MHRHGLDINQEHRLVRAFVANGQPGMAVDSHALTRDLGLSLADYDAAQRTLSLRCRLGAQHVQGGGAVHGGVTTTVLDYALAFACMAELVPPQAPATVSLSVEFRRPVVPGEYLATGRVTQGGSRLYFAQASLKPAAGPDVVLVQATAVLAIVGH